MRKLILSLILGISLVSLALPVSGQAELVELKVAINENRPLAFFDEDDVPAGFYVDLLNYISEEEGWKLEYVEFPRAETLDLVDEGEIDLIATIGYHELFIDRYVFTEEKILNNWGIVYVQADSTIESLLELEGKSIAVLEASTHGKHFENLLDDFEIESTIIEVGSFADVANLLERGEVDAGVLNRMIGVSFGEIYEIKGTSIIFNPIDVRLAASPATSPFVIERIDAHLQELKSDTNSYYYQSFSRWFGPAEQLIFPNWATWVFGVGGGAILLLAGISFFLRYQVREKTAALVVQNEALFAEIEEHKKTHIILKESEERYKGVVENNPVLICSFTPDGKITYANQAYCQYFSIQFDEVIGFDFLKLIPESDRKMVMANILKLTVESPTQTHEHQVIDPDGEIRWQHWTNQALFDDKGRRIAFQSIGSDITERKQAEEALQQSAQEMTALNAVSAQVNRALSVKEVASAAVEGMLRATEASIAFLLIKEEAALVPIKIAYSKPEKELDVSLIGRASSCISEMALRESEPVYSKELYDDTRCTADECKQVGFQSSAALPLFVDGEIYAILGVGADTFIDFEAQSEFLETLASEISNGLKNAHLFTEIQRDLSERKKMEMALIESEDKFRTLFATSPVGIGVADQRGNLLLFNDAMLLPGGYSQADLQEIGNVSRLYKDSVQRDEALGLFQKEGFIKDYPVQFKRKDGSYYDAFLSLAPIRFGGQSCIQAIVQDVTESKRANEMLMESERKLSTLMSNLPGMAYRCKNDIDWTMEFVSDGCEILTGYKAEDILNNANISYGEIIAPEDRDVVWSNVQNALSNRRDFQITYRIFTAAGDEKWVWEKGQGIFDKNGEFTALEGFITDINDRKKAEDEILKYNMRLDALRKIDQAIINTFDLRVTLNIILDHIQSHLQIDAAVILKHDENTHTLSFVQGVGFRTKALQHTNPRVGHGYAGRVALQRELVHISDLSTSDYGLLDSPEFDAENFVAYYGVPLLSKGVLVGVLEVFTRSNLEPDTEWVKYLETLAGQAAIAIDNISLFENLERSNAKLMHAYDATIEGWASALELRDMETEGHSRRVVDTTIALAKMLGISGSNLTHVRRGALLHDIGKMGVPDSILQKTGPLTDDEWAIMKQHPALSHRWLASIDYLRPALDIPYCHHEKWDGSGYPRGLKGEQIPLAARIFAIVDVWDALRSDRPYRKAWADEDALEHIKEQSGTHFDPRVVTAFLQYLEKIK